MKQGLRKKLVWLPKRCPTINSSDSLNLNSLIEKGTLSTKQTESLKLVDILKEPLLNSLLLFNKMVLSLPSRERDIAHELDCEFVVISALAS